MRICIIGVFYDGAAHGTVRNNDALICRRADDRMPQGDFLDRTTDSDGRRLDHISDHKRLERQNHYTTDHIAQRILTRQTDNHCHQTAAGKQRRERVARTRNTADNRDRRDKVYDKQDNIAQKRHQRRALVSVLLQPLHRCTEKFVHHPHKRGGDDHHQHDKYNAPEPGWQMQQAGNALNALNRVLRCLTGILHRVADGCVHPDRGVRGQASP